MRYTRALPLGRKPAGAPGQSRPILVAAGFVIGWAALLLLVSVVLSGCEGVDWRRTAEWCEALSPALRAMVECVK